jgi:hypothetical protein
MERCMKGLQTVLSCILGLLVTAGTASAGIVFLKDAGATTVSPRPEHLALADFNGDGLIDIVTSSPNSHEVNVLLGNPDGALTPGTVFTIGNQISDITTGDLNGDGVPDIVVADERSDGVFVMLNNDNGTFAPPALKNVGRNPFAVAIADFDGVNGNDLAITDRATDRVFILLNDGRPSPNFSGQPIDYQVGQSPQEIIVADFNGDGAADIVTLNQGGARVKSVTMLLFERVTQGFPIFERLADFGVGERVENLITGDFNEDDIRDLGLINRPFGAFNQGEVQFLFGQGNGFLNLVDAVELPCPFFTGGLRCDAVALGAGDFDADGHVDLAVTQLDPRVNQLGDILIIYTGEGDGTYAPGPVFTTDAVPDNLAVGHAAGNGLPDIFVSSNRLKTIQLFVNHSSGQEDDRLPGQRCDDRNQCTTTYCEDGVCCRTECIDGVEACNIPGSEGTCLLLEDNRPNGFSCEEPDQCQSGFCTDGICCVTATCPSDTRCDIPEFLGTCHIPLPIGDECEADENCRTGRCVDTFCCDSDCPNGRCDIPGLEGTCTPFRGLGQTCSLDDQCVSSICDVVGRICCNTTCAATEECTADGMSCVAARTPIPNVTPGSDGAPCTNADQCDSGFCEDNVCCKVDDCAGSLVCAFGTGECASPTTTPGSGNPTPTPDLACGACPAGCPCVNGLCLCASRGGGGCSTTDPGDSREIFLALLLPAGLLMARRRKAARARAHSQDRR